MQTEVAQFLLDNFKGRENFIAYAPKNEHFKPHQLNTPLPVEKFASSHLQGETCLGFYLLTSRNTVWCTCLDFDDHGKNPEAIQQGHIAALMLLMDFNFHPVFEISSSGTGCHVWLLFEEEVPGWLVRLFWKTFIDKYISHGKPEQYPKQDDLQGKKLGNLVRYPLFGQSKFIKLPDGTDLDPLELAQTLHKHTGDDLRAFLESEGIDTQSPKESILEHSGASEDVLDCVLPERVKNLLEENQNSPLYYRWMAQTTGLMDGSYSGIMMSLAAEMVRAYIPTDDVRESLTYWCKLRQYTKPLEREDVLERTINKAYEMMWQRGEKKILVGETFDKLAHSYADIVFENEDILYPTGIRDIDESIGGLAKAELGIVSSRPSQGKTALSIQWMDKVASLGDPTLYVSLEMSSSENARRVLLRLSDGIQASWKTEQGNKHLHQKIDSHFKNRAPMYFIEGTYEISRLEDAIENYVKDYGVRFVVVDYQGLATVKELRFNEYAEQTEITKRLKKSAKLNDIAILSLVQMKRVENDHADREPQLSDLRSSGEIEQSADLILFNRWPFMYDQERSKEEYVVWCKKARNREIKKVKMDLMFESSIQTFR